MRLKQGRALKADESEIRKEIRKIKVKSKKESKLIKDAIKSAELISTFGKAALLTLAGKGLNVSDAVGILKKESAVNENLVELIIESEKEVLKRRFYKRKTKVRTEV